MDKGLLHQKKFNLKPPILKKEVVLFRQELADRMKKYGITTLCFF